MPKKRLISGICGLAAQGGENILRLLARCSKIQGVWAEINLVTPNKLSERTDLNLFEKMLVSPQRKNAFPDQLREVHHPTHTIVKGQFKAMTLQYLHLCDPKHYLIPPYILLIPQIGILWKSVDATSSQRSAKWRPPLDSGKGQPRSTPSTSAD
jgi:hypothetical protein